MTGVITAAVCLQLVLWLFAKHLPSRPAEEVSAEERQVLIRRYRWVNIAGLPLFIVFGAGFTWCWAVILHGLAKWRLSTLPPSIFRFAPGENLIAWGVPGMFFAIVSVGILMDILLRIVLRARYDDYIRAEEARTRIDMRKGGLLLIGMLSVVVSLSIRGMDWYIRADRKEIAISRFWWLGERVYSYGEVHAVAKATHLKAPSGAIVQRTRYFILFSDGSEWCNEDVWCHDDPKNFEREHAFFEFVSQQSGKPVQTVTFINELVRN